MTPEEKLRILEARILQFKNHLYEVGIETMNEEVLKLHDDFVEYFGVTTQRAGSV